MTEPPGERGGPDQKTRLPECATTKQQQRSDRPVGDPLESVTPGERAMLERIKEAARQGSPAPTTDELLELLGCSSYSTPVAALRRLQLRGFFVFDSFQRGRRFWLPDGRSTAPVSCSSPPWRWRDREMANG